MNDQAFRKDGAHLDFEVTSVQQLCFQLPAFRSISMSHESESAVPGVEFLIREFRLSRRRPKANSGNETALLPSVERDGN